MTVLLWVSKSSCSNIVCHKEPLIKHQLTTQRCWTLDWIGLCMVLCPRQHSIGYMGDGVEHWNSTADMYCTAVQDPNQELCLPEGPLLKGRECPKINQLKQQAMSTNESCFMEICWELAELSRTQTDKHTQIKNVTKLSGIKTQIIQHGHKWRWTAHMLTEWNK